MVAGDFFRPAQPKAQFAINVTQCWIRLNKYLFQPRDDLCRAALQDCLVNLCFQSEVVVCVWTQRSEQRRGPRQVALGLSDTCFEGKRIDIVRCNIENLIKLSQRFGKTTKAVIVTR